MKYHIANAGKMKIKRIIFILCPIHRKCAQRVFNMEYPLCNFKHCEQQRFRSLVNAYKGAEAK